LYAIFRRLFENYDLGMRGDLNSRGNSYNERQNRAPMRR
jgi:hypothetical protein